MATGVLPLLLGKATPGGLLAGGHGQNYEAGFRLGLATDTEDVTGKVLETSEAPVSRAVLEKVLAPVSWRNHAGAAHVFVRVQRRQAPL